MPDKKTVIDQADARKKVGDHRKLKHHAKCQNQPRYDRKIFTHLYQWLYLDGFIPAQQKFESELQENFITKKNPGKKKKRTKKRQNCGCSAFRVRRGPGQRTAKRATREPAKRR